MVNLKFGRYHSCLKSSFSVSSVQHGFYLHNLIQLMDAAIGPCVVIEFLTCIGTIVFGINKTQKEVLF